MYFFYGTWVKVALLASLIVLAVVHHLLVRRGKHAAKRWVSLAALPLVVAAVVSFNAHGQPWNRRFLNNHDVYHYYFGAKYSHELGYDLLYHCTVVALDEIDPKLHKDVKTIRSLVDYKHLKKKRYLDRPRRCTDHFSPARWAEFKQDLQDFRKGRVGSFKEKLGDKGYNPSPVWNMTGRFIAELIPPQPPLVFNLLGVLDLVLLTMALLLSFRAFGWLPTALAILYLAGCFALTKTHIRGAFLRLDWLAALIAALAALQLRRHRLAGALLGFATMVRIFPVFFLFGPAVLAGDALLRTRRLPAAYRQLFGSFFVSCLLLFGASVVIDGNLQRWGGFVSKIELHARDIATTRIGLDYALGYRGEYRSVDLKPPDGKGHFRPEYVAAKQDVHRSMRWWKAILTGLVLGLLARGLRRRDAVEAMALSFPVVFCLSNPTFYYWCLLVPPALGLAARAHKLPMLVALVALAGMEISYHLIPYFGVRFEVLQHAIYAMEVGLVVLITLEALRRWPEREGSAPEPAAGAEVGEGEGTAARGGAIAATEAAAEAATRTMVSTSTSTSTSTTESTSTSSPGQVMA